MTERSTSRSSGQQGFSLLEMLSVIAIILVVMAIAFPKYSQIVRAYRIRNDANNISGLLGMARMRAASSFSRAKVSCDSTTRKCTLSTKQIGGNWPSTPNEPVQVTLSAGVSFAIPSGVTKGVGNQTGSPVQGTTGQTNPYYVEFNSRGLPIDDAGAPVSNYALYLKDDSGLSTAVSVDFSGKTMVHTLQGNAYSALKE